MCGKWNDNKTTVCTSRSWKPESKYVMISEERENDTYSNQPAKLLKKVLEKVDFLDQHK